MMNKWLKGTLIASAAVTVAGAVLLGVGIALGGSPFFYYDTDGLHVKENTEETAKQDYVLESTKIGALSSLELDLHNADLQIVSGDDWSVEYVLDGECSQPVYSVENGTLILKEGSYLRTGYYRFGFGYGNGWMYDSETMARSPYVKITVPENARLDSVNISSGYGKISIEKNLRADSAVVYGEYGNIRLDGWTGDTLNVETEYGDLTAGTLDGSEVTIRGAYGSLQIDSLKTDLAAIESEYGDVTADVDQAQSVDVDCSDGEVRLNLAGKLEDYGVSLYSEYGTIRVPQGTVESDDYDGSSSFIRLADGQDTAGIQIETEYGDIRIREK